MGRSTIDITSALVLILASDMFAVSKAVHQPRQRRKSNLDAGSEMGTISSILNQGPVH
jgi:hypothetical protein